ncbi:hypothetical protein ACTFIZ_002438 [Dictyostelium cf. discoideum]
MNIKYFIFIIINILLISNHVKSNYNTFIFENIDGFPACNREVPIDKCTTFCGGLYGGFSYSGDNLLFYEGEDCYLMVHGNFICSDNERTSFQMNHYFGSWYRESFNYWVNCTWTEENEPETPSPTENTSSSFGNDDTFECSSEHFNDTPTPSHSESYTDYNGNDDEDPQGNIGISLSSPLIFISILFLIIFINN